MKIASLIRALPIVAALSTGSLFANMLHIADTPYDGGLPGGEFAVTGAGAFATFCIEYDVHVYLPGDYYYTIDLAAQNQGDTLSVGSAWLYEQFSRGTLTGPAGSGLYTDSHNVNAGLLQQAFWFLEGETGGVNDGYVALAVAHFTSLALAQANIDASSSVKVLNLWTNSDGTGDIQSQLIFVPDGGLTVALLGLGLISLVAFRRKL